MGLSATIEAGEGGSFRLPLRPLTDAGHDKPSLLAVKLKAGFVASHLLIALFKASALLFGCVFHGLDHTQNNFHHKRNLPLHANFVRVWLGHQVRRNI